MKKHIVKQDDIILANSLYEDVKKLLIASRKKVYSLVNKAMIDTYWNIGKLIVEKQGGNERSEYGSNLIDILAKQLTNDFGKGFTSSNLKYMRKFYLTFPNRHAVSDELTWTHYRLLMKVEHEKARNFYITESIKSQWSTRQLERQINTFFYERLLSSQNKAAISEELYLNDDKCFEAEDIVKDPYVLEFAGLKENTDFYENDLENALISNLQKFLLELGRGFSFVARQKRITLDGKSFYIDLVFYNYILKCFVLIDLKLGELTHQDIGQMQMYLHYYEREMTNNGDNLPIGIILCSDKSDTIIKYTLPENEKNIFASKYKLYMPTEQELKEEINRNLLEKE